MTSKLKATTMKNPYSLHIRTVIQVPGKLTKKQLQVGVVLLI